MTTALITYFGPFEGVTVNPTKRVAERAQQILGQRCSWLTVVVEELPVTFAESGEQLRGYIQQYSPDMVVSTGVAVGRSRVSIERVAINCDDASIADNNGDKRQDTPIALGGPAAYFTTLPYRQLQDELSEQGLPVEISNTAGTYVCNHVFYELMHATAGSRVPAGFIHIPAVDDGAADELVAHQDAGGVQAQKVPTLDVETVALILALAIQKTVASL